MEGRDKLLIKIKGVEQIRRITSEAKKTNSTVIITLPNPDHPRAKIVRDLGVKLVQLSNNNLGMGESIGKGIKEAFNKKVAGAMIVPADMPELICSDFNLLIKQFKIFPDSILQATTSNNEKGHPVIFPRSLFSQLTRLTGDRGARGVIASNQHIYKEIRLPFRRAITDLDTEKEWKDWLRKNNAMARKN